jgi:hypothetical protein
MGEPGKKEPEKIREVRDAGRTGGLRLAQPKQSGGKPKLPRRK